MPELPEVELLVRVLRPRICGRKLIASPSSPAAHAERISGIVADALRAGKWIVVVFADGRRLGIHLRMSGRVTWAHTGEEMPQRLIASWRVGRRELRLADPRRLARVVPVPAGRRAPWDGLGPDPLDPAFDARYLVSRLAARSTPVKAALMDPAVAPGVGNIYACEALHVARVHPSVESRRIGPRRAERLVDALRATLGEALDRGARILDSGAREPLQGDLLFYYRDGRPTVDAWWRVYGREGEPCPDCGAVVRRIPIAGRGTWFCPRCQRHR